MLPLGKPARPVTPRLQIVRPDTPAFQPTLHGQIGEPNPKPFTITNREGVR